MRRRIMVTGECQAPGVWEGLKIMLEDDDIALVARPMNPADKEAFFEQIRSTDIWVTAGRGNLAESEILAANPNLETLCWPQTVFPAFHPDISYAFHAGRHITAMECVYNSVICLWGWRHGVPAEDTIRLFCGEVFGKLGYLDAWRPSVEGLKNDFERCDLDFERFYLPVKRQGVFMHSNNHAKLSPTLHIARQIAVKLGASEKIYDEPFENYMNDPLVFDAVWPVYPEIGDVLGVSSSYLWKYRHNFCNGLSNYVGASYQDYEKQGFQPGELNCERVADAAVDVTLREHLG